jgi:glucose-6-phosphate isomerase
MGKITDLEVWKKLQAHRTHFHGHALAKIYDADTARVARMSFRLDGLEADFSRNHVTPETLALLLELAEARGVEMLRDAMFAGKKINESEKRAVLHTALRRTSPEALMLDGEDVGVLVRETDKRLAAFAGAVRDGSWTGATGKKITHIVNIGIGGSDLGPRLVVSALRSFAGPLSVRFAANVDANEMEAVLKGLDPARTLFVVVSKTFTTLETLMNARFARAWLVKELGEAAVAKHFVAVSTNQPEVERFGIAPANMFPLWDWVGGRYSLWSAVGLSIALAIGWDGFLALRAGAAAMDAHFRTAPLASNMPVLLGLIGLWYRNFWGSGAHAILPYAEKLRDLPRFLQQLDMESNGKRVTRDGALSEVSTGPVIFGECGTVGQHSFHQWLHQGTDVTPADFIGIREDDSGKPEHHRALLANLVAQAEALLRGRAMEDPARTNPGDRPSTLLWLDKLDPYNLGLLLALYEQKVFVQGAIWGLNSFDQWGVELGKILANEKIATGI